MNATLTATLAATPTKLKTGAWGAKVTSQTVRTGDLITITTRAGKSWTAHVAKVLWTGDGVAICSTSTSPSGRTTRRNTTHRDVGGRDICGYPCPVSGRRCTASDPCHDCF